jgi:PKD repeat protein
LIFVLFLSGCGTNDIVTPNGSNENEVPPLNNNPSINSTPVTSAFVGQPYNYDVNATDADGDTLTYSLNTNLTGMTINSTTGLINWVPYSAGNYKVIVKVTDGDLFDTQEFNINVSEVPAECYTICSSSGPNGSISPSGIITVAQGANKTFYITPDNGYQIDDVLVDESSMGKVSSFTFTDILSNHSIHANFIEEVPTNQPPIADFDVDVSLGVAPLNVSFDASNSYDPDGSIVSYEWNFKDGNIGSGQTIDNTFNSAGSYDVKLIVTDNEGDTDSTSMIITVIQGTLVGGIITEDTTWTKENSPYIISNTVQIPSGIKLTINAGVTVDAPSSVDMFLINGEVFAHGTQTERIIFDGGNNSNFFNSKNSGIDTFLDLEYCKIMNGESFWPPSGCSQHGAFSLKNSTLENLTYYSYIWYPKQDIYIEYNKFINTGGFSVGHDDNIKVYIRYNLFDTKNPNLPSYADYCVQNWVAYSSSQTIVKYNSFINMDGIVLKLPGGYPSTSMIATENYWGTQDTTEINDMIYDKNDDITCANYIEYEPILTEPHPNVP